jgi:uncharacterized repeat protein (TIGR03803 family)
VVFKLDPSGKETVLYAFTGGADGEGPQAGLVRDGTGSLYGTTFYGGNTSDSCPLTPYGCGVVFKLDPTGQHHQALYTFTGGADGSNPTANLIRDTAGNLYGTASGGGASCGVVFKLDELEKYTVLHSFSCTDGYSPQAGLLLYRSSLYGTTLGGGAYSHGVVFRLQ